MHRLNVDKMDVEQLLEALELGWLDVSVVRAALLRRGHVLGVPPYSVALEPHAYSVSAGYYGRGES